MEVLQKELEKLQRDANLSQSIQDVDSIIEQLEKAREAILADPNAASSTLVKLQNPLKNGFDKVNDDLKKIYKGHSNYGKVLERNLPSKTLPTSYDALASQPSLINRAIAMHLLREGQFSVAQTFLSEAIDNPPHPAPTPGTPNPSLSDSTDLTSLQSDELQGKFSNMYEIVSQLKAQNLHPAIQWAQDNSEELERRGSNLGFELTRLQYLWLFQGPEINGLPDDDDNGILGAFRYAHENFPRFSTRHRAEAQRLLTAILYRSNIANSPYRHSFDTQAAWEEVSASFTREFCSLLGLSAESPIYVAATAGAIALPTLLKLATIVREKRTEWTTQSELPVEIPLPSSMIFHAIFVCPVSKEQTTEINPPMMIPCGHVVAKESLARLSKGSRFKCPYCPNESHMRDAVQITL